MDQLDSPQLDFRVPDAAPRPTGDAWRVTREKPASVPVPLPVIMVRVEGSYTALDRKLWLLLLHNAWDNLEKPGHIHEARVADVLRLFRQFGRRDLGARGEVEVSKRNVEQSEAAAIWQSVRRLVKTTVDWEDADYQGISALLASAMTSKTQRESGRIYYTFSPQLAKNVLIPRSFARLRIHFVMGLRSKYAVTLYEILEGYVNRREPSATVSIEELRNWLKVPDDAYQVWKDLKRNVIAVAVDEINKHAGDAGFYVTYEPIRVGKAYTKIKFTVMKTPEREEIDEKLQRASRHAHSFTTKLAADRRGEYQPNDLILDQVAEAAPGWDRQALLARFQAWSRDKELPANPHGAFLGWVKRFTKGKPPGYRSVGEDML